MKLFRVGKDTFIAKTELEAKMSRDRTYNFTKTIAPAKEITADEFEELEYATWYYPDESNHLWLDYHRGSIELDGSVITHTATIQEAILLCERVSDTSHPWAFAADDMRNFTLPLPILYFTDMRIEFQFNENYTNVVFSFPNEEDFLLATLLL